MNIENNANDPNHSKMFRAERTTKNRDDFKVLMVGAVITILLMLTIPLYGKVWDKYLSDRPFVSATLEIIQTDDYANPMLMYDADATQLTDAVWVAVVRDANDVRLETRRGNGTYTSQIDNPRLWTWESFFDNELGGLAPRVPTQPFMVCVSYTSEARRSGVLDETPEICSKIFYPQ